MMLFTSGTNSFVNDLVNGVITNKDYIGKIQSTDVALASTSLVFNI